jgi:hypothetical protein
MVRGDYHKIFSSIYFENIPGYPNEFKVDERWLNDHPKFEGSVILHIIGFLRYLLEVGTPHEDVQINLFIFFLPSKV